jgi:hypothetical protein
LSISHRWNEHLLDLMLGDVDEPYEDTLERMEEEWGEWWTRTSFGAKLVEENLWAEVILMTRETAFLFRSPGDTFDEDTARIDKEWEGWND